MNSSVALTSSQHEVTKARRLPAEFRVQLLPLMSLIIVLCSFFRLAPGGDALSTDLSLIRLYRFLMLAAGFGVILLWGTLNGQSLHMPRREHTVVWMFVLWAISSALWSVAPLLTLAKAIELALLVLWAYLLSQVLLASSATSRDLSHFLSVGLLITVGLGLCINIWIWGEPLYVVQYYQRERLQIGYTHPGTSGYLFALTIIAVATTKWKWWAKLFVAIPILYLNELTDTRIASAGVAVTLVVLWLQRTSTATRFLIIWTALTTFFLFLTYVVVFRTDGVVGATSSLLPPHFWTLNGRIPLWHFAWELIQERPFHGFGYAAARYPLLSRFEWAGDAHNTWVEFQLTTGVVGLILLIAFAFQVLRQIHKGRATNQLLLGVATYALIASITSVALLTPDLTMTVLLLVLFADRYQLSEPVSGVQRYLVAPMTLKHRT